MAACLAHLTATSLSERSDGPEMQRLQDLTIECGSLLVITLVGNPGGFKDLQNCNMDEGVVCPDAQPPSFYCDVMVSCCAVRLPSLAGCLQLALAMFCVWLASCLLAQSEPTALQCHPEWFSIRLWCRHKALAASTLKGCIIDCRHAHTSGFCRLICNTLTVRCRTGFISDSCSTTSWDS